MWGTLETACSSTYRVSERRLSALTFPLTSAHVSIHVTATRRLFENDRATRPCILRVGDVQDDYILPTRCKT